MVFPRLRYAYGVLLLLAGLLFSTPSAYAQTVSTLLSLPATIHGVQSGVILGDDGFLYGTAVGTASVSGVVYKVQPNGGGFQVIYTFSAPGSSGANVDGQYPARELAAPGDGYLYGTCTNGGLNGLGTVYRVSLDGTLFQTLFSFSAEDSQFENDYGANPLSGLVANGDGYLYGTTNAGGPYSEGTVYRISTDGTVIQLLHAFTFGSAADGDNVYASLLWGGDGYFYGTTQAGGAHSAGAVYRLKSDGTSFSLLHSFTSAEGGSYAAVMRGLDGRLYGVSFHGGANQDGLLWGLNTDGTGFAPIHVFTAYDTQGHNTDGAGPYGALATGPDGALYGTTESGGTVGDGVVFKVNPDGSAFTTLDLFGAASGEPLSPFGSLERIGSVIYGTTSLGGSLGSGTIFQISGLSTVNPATSHAQILWNNVNGQACLWTVNPNSTFVNAVFGPFSGWTARAVSEAPDGADWLLWTNTSGQASLWRVTAPTANGYTHTEYGPYAGYTAVSFSIGSDGSPRLLWDKIDGTALLWTVNHTTGAFTYTSYGPFRGWTANHVASGPNVTDLLWTNTSGMAAGYRISIADGTYFAHAFGPYSGYVSAGLSVGPDNGAHLLWDKTDGTALLWSADFNSGAFTYTSYGPFSGYSARAIATGPDGGTRMLWDNANGQVSLWDVVGSGHTHTEYGPFTGWSAVALSAGL